MGGFAITHEPSLRYLKARLVFEDGGAFLVEGDERVPVIVEGPAFEVTAFRLDEAAARGPGGARRRQRGVGWPPTRCP